MNDLTDAWVEWHKLCTIDKCSAEHAGQLCQVSNSVFKRTLNWLEEETGRVSMESFSTIDQSLMKYPQESDEEFAERKKRAKENENRYTFHLMETECLPIGTIEERRIFKDRIFSGAKSPGEVTGYFFNSFFRTYLTRKENLLLNTEKENPNIENPEDFKEKILTIAARDAGMTMPPSPDEELKEKEFIPIAKHFWGTLNETERAAVYAYSNHCTMSHPELLKKVGLGKSVFSAMPMRLMAKYGVMVQEKYGLGTDSTVIPDAAKPKEAWKKKKLNPEDMHFMTLALHRCFSEWEKQSDMGKWFTGNMCRNRETAKKTNFKISPEI